MGTLRVFCDTNILISGLFFEGPEARLLVSPRIQLVTGEICREELFEVIRRKFKQFGRLTLSTVLEEAERALLDIEIIPAAQAVAYREEAARYLPAGNDRLVLAAGLASKADYFLSGDKTFHRKALRERLNQISTQKLLQIIGD